ncbi:MAG: (d)CMP kinase [Halanaerobiales bacterium]
MEKVIAIDGPAGAGKSTVARKLARHLNYKYLDTGAMYRAVTLAVLNEDISPANEKEVSCLACKIKLNFGQDSRIFLNGRDVSGQIRTARVDCNVSRVASYREVRNAMLDLQREIASRGKIVMDGRDIGTRVLPDAEYKFFITATLEERARRRYREIKEKNPDTNFSEIKERIKKRDRLDRQREHSPLVRSEDAVMIDTTELTVDEVLNKILVHIEKDD